MKNFEDAIAALSKKKIVIVSVTTSRDGTVVDPVSPNPNRKRFKRRVITPLGDFESLTLAARAAGVSPNSMFMRIKNKMEGHFYGD